MTDYTDPTQDPAAPDSPQYQYGKRGAPPPPPTPRFGTGWGFNALNSCLVAGCVTVFVPVLIVFGFMALLYALMSSSLSEATSGSLASFVQTSNMANNVHERVLRAGDSGAGTIAVVNIQGVIDGNGSPLDGNANLAFISRQLRSAGDNDAVKAVILQIDSPGGGLTPSDQIHHEIQLLRRKGKPVLAWAGGMMMSGGYYIAVAADKIMANPTSTVGSIGVLLQRFQVSELMEKIGVKVAPITSGEHKDIGSPFRDMTPEEERMLREYVDESHNRFVGIVAKGRDMAEDKVRALADGGIFTADMALERGLVDSIGYIEDAIEWAEKAANEKNMRVVGYRRLISFGDIFAETGRGAATAVLEAVKREPGIMQK